MQNQLSLTTTVNWTYVVIYNGENQHEEFLILKR